MRVQGVDPIMLNRIQQKVKKQAVQKSEQAYISADQERRRQQGQKQTAGDAEKLAQAVIKLNRTAEALGIELLFVLDEETSTVFVVEKATEEIIRQIEGERVYEMLAEMKGFVGMMVDYVR